MTEQEIRVLNYLREHGSVTKLESIQEIGCVNPAARITQLIRYGYPIRKVRECGPNRFGEPTHWTRYVLKEESNNGNN